MHATLLVLALATCASTLLGGSLLLRYRDSPHYFFAFAAGSIITVAFLDLLPECILVAGMSHVPLRRVLLGVVTSFFFYSLVDHFFLTHHLHGDDAHGHPMGPVGAGSLVLHSFLDGVAIAVAFQASASVGIIVASAVVIHDFTDGLNTVAVMLRNRHSAAQARLFLALDAAAPVLGALGGFWLAVPERGLAYLLAFFVGEFLYIGAAGLLPEIQERGSAGGMAAMFLGTALVTVLTALV